MTTPFEPIAIIGIGCRFPGANDPRAFWRLVSEGVDAVGLPGPSRHLPSTSEGGYLDQVEYFDPAFFGISPRQAEWMDPAQRLFLEVACESIQDAGIAFQRLQDSSTGIFVGVAGNEYAPLIHQQEHPTLNVFAATGAATSIVANRLSYFLNVHGPSLVVDTACSSSLVAVHLACRSIQSGDCDSAIVGGVHLLLNEETTQALQRGGFLSSTGRCRAFDASADGYVRGEGAGAVLLKPLSAALREGNPIYAVISGTATNQDGRSNGLTAPNLQAQQTVLRQCWQRAGLRGDQIQYVEAHGSCTQLGDPIEVKALAGALQSDRPREEPCWIGTVKSNLGHLEGASGIAGLLKTVLAMHHQQIPPSLQVKDLNPYISFDSVPIQVATESKAWLIDKRIAGVSSFGFGGTNAHAVLVSPEPAKVPTARTTAKYQLITLSAKTPAALRQYCQAFADYCTDNPQVSLPQLARACRQGRSEWKHCAAFVADSLADAAAKFASIAAEEAIAEREILLGTAKELESFRHQLITRYGEGIEWNETSSSASLPLMLPTHPYQRKRFPLPQVTAVATNGEAREASEHQSDQSPPPQQEPPSTPAGEPTQRDRILEILIQEFRTVIALAEDPDPEADLFDLGLDSMMGMELHQRLSDRFGGVSLPADTLLKHRTISALATELSKHASLSDQEASQPSRPSIARIEGSIGEFEEVKQFLQRIERQIHNPYFQVHHGVPKDKTHLGTQEVLSFTSYNYLGLNGHPEVTRAATRAIEEEGTSVSASRIVSGERQVHQELERQIARFLGCEAAIVMVAGHPTNVTVLGHLFGPSDTIVYDSLSHNSIQQGIQLSGAKARAFAHNDMQSLTRILEEVRPVSRRVVIVVEGVYSMDGDTPPLDELVKLKHRYQTLLYVDEAHSIGVLGPTGRGIAEHYGIDRQEVDFWMGTLSKSFASCGGYIAGSRQLIEYLKYTAPGFVFSVGLPPGNAAAALASLRMLEQHPELPQQLREKCAFFLKLMQERRINTGTCEATPVVPCILGNSELCIRLCQGLLRRGVHVLPIVYPGVAEDQARLRFFVTVQHTREQLQYTADVLDEELNALRSPRNLISS